MMTWSIKRYFKWLMNLLLVFFLGAGGMLLLTGWLITLDERGVSPKSMYSWLLDGQLRRLPQVEGLVLQDHDLIASDGGSVGFDRSNYLVIRNDFDLSRWRDYFLNLGYAEAEEVENSVCTNASINFESKDWVRSACIKIDDRLICLEYGGESVGKNFQCPEPSIFGGSTCVINHPGSSRFSIFIEKKLRPTYVQICRDFENKLIRVSKSN